MIEFTDDELIDLYDILYDTVYFGDDEIVHTSEGDHLRSALVKVKDGLKKRQL